MRSNRPLEQPTFAQTVVICRHVAGTEPFTTSPTQADFVEAIIRQHLALRFHYNKDQIYRALDALNQRNRPSAR